MENFQFTPFNTNYLEAVKIFSDQWIGRNYFSVAELQEYFLQSQKDGLNASLLAWSGDRLVGVRLTLAPGCWILPEMRITPSLWKVPPERVGYFKSLFVDEEFRAQGIGQELSKRSQRILERQGALAVVTHSWLESPLNSSQRYLLKAGFSEVAQHEKFWQAIDYECTRCSPKRCECTAVEMIKIF